MWFSTHRAQTGGGSEAVFSQLDSLRETVRKLTERIDALEGEEFKLSELRRQARNAVRSLERAAANAQEPPGPSNGKGRGVGDLPRHPEPPGPRRNY